MSDEIRIGSPKGKSSVVFASLIFAIVAMLFINPPAILAWITFFIAFFFFYIVFSAFSKEK